MKTANIKSERPASIPTNSLLNRPVNLRADSSPLLQHGRALHIRSDTSELSANSLAPSQPLIAFPPSHRTWDSSPYSHGSACSSTASLYLGPPPSETDNTEAPPFKPFADDGVSLSMVEGSRRFRKARRKSSRRWQSEGILTEPPGDEARIRRQQRRRSRVDAREATRTSIEGRQKFANQSRRSSTAPSTATRGPKQPFQNSNRRGSWWWRLRTITIGDDAVVDQLASKSQIRGNWLRTVQPATDLSAQENFGQSEFSSTTTVTTTRRWSSIQDGAAAIASLTTAFAPPPLSENFVTQPSSHETQESQTWEWVGRNVSDSAREHRKRRLHREGGEARKRWTESPATITLRRASGAPQRRSSTTFSYPSTIQSRLQDAMDDLTKNGPPLLSSELQSSRQSKSPATTVSSNSTSPDHRSLSAGRGIGESLIQSRQGEAADPHATPTLPRQILTAEPATTFTHVQVATPIATGFTGAQEVSMAHHQLSTTQTVQARSSVYEIIWNDDYSSDSPDSSDRTPPESKEQPLGPISSHSDIDLNSTSTDKHPDVPSDQLASVQSRLGSTVGSRNSKVHNCEPFAKWGWTANRRRSIPTTIENTPEVAVSDIPVSSASDFFENDDNVTAPVLVVQSVQSFPPLLDRSSTQDWITPCLIDLNDPLAGRTSDYEHPSSPSVAEISASDSLDAQMKLASPASDPMTIPRNKRGSIVQSHFSAPQRLADNTKTGYALGASSGMRRRSVQVPRKRSSRRLSFTTGANPLASSPTSTHSNPLLMLSDAAPSQEGDSTTKSHLVAPHTDSGVVKSRTTGLQARGSEDEPYPSMDSATGSLEVQRYDSVNEGTRATREEMMR